MANNNLLKVLNNTENLGKIVLIHTDIANYPLADFVLEKLKTKFHDYHKQYFTADRYFNFSEIEAITNSVSLFNQSGYLVISFKTKPNAEQQKQLINLINNQNESTFITIICDKLTKTEQNANWYKTITAHGIDLGISSFDANTIVTHLLTSYNLSITNDALNTLINQNQGNLSQLINETNKLILSVPQGQNIGINEIATITTDNAQYNIYQLSSSYLAGDLSKSIKILENLYQENGDAIMILWVLQEDIKRLLKIKSKLKTTNNIRQIIQEMRIWGEAVDKLPIAEKRLKYTTLIEIYEKLAQLDMSIKGVLQLDVYLLLVTIIKSICGH